MNWKVFDLHCDTVMALIDRNLESGRMLLRNEGHIDLERAAALDGYAQCFAIFTCPSHGEWFGCPVTEVFERAYGNFCRELDRNSDRIAQARSPEEIRQNDARGKMSAIFTLEGPAGIDYDPARLEELYRRGLRMSTLGWNEQNVLCGSNQTGGGLTDLGREYVRECQRLGILVDVSHLSEQGFWDIMEMTEAPVIATHSNARAVCNQPRNLTDEMYRAICQTGGTAGINLYSEFLGDGEVELDQVVRHISHFLELDPSGTHLSLGGDLDGCSDLPRGFTGIDCYNALGDRLVESGLDQDTVQRIFWTNAMGVMDRAVRNHQK